MPGRSDNDIKNHFYSIVRRNIRVYNRKKPNHLKLKGSVLEIIKEPQLAKVLLVPSKEGICKKPINQTQVTVPLPVKPQPTLNSPVVFPEEATPEPGVMRLDSQSSILRLDSQQANRYDSQTGLLKLDSFSSALRADSFLMKLESMKNETHEESFSRGNSFSSVDFPLSRQSSNNLFPQDSFKLETGSLPSFIDILKQLPEKSNKEF